MIPVDTQHFLSLIWKISLQAGIFAAVVWLIVRCAGKTSARLRYALWVLVLVKFLIPPVVDIPSEVAFWQKPYQSVSVTSVATEPAPQNFGSTPSSGAVPVAATPSTVSSQPMAASKHDSPRVFAAVNTGRLLVAAWAVGTLIMLTLLLLRVRRQGEFIRNCDDAGEQLSDLLARATGSMGLRRVPDAKFSRMPCAPTLAGLRCPTIVLPPPDPGSCSESQTEAMLLHELAHIKRRDMLVLWLYELTRVLFFFHPAIWLVGRGLAAERELACDELVLASRSIAPEDYAAGYVSALRMAASAVRPPVSVAMAEPFEMEKRRLQMILKRDLPKGTVWWLMVVVMVAAIGLPTFAGVARNDSRTTNAKPREQTVQTQTMAPAEVKSEANAASPLTESVTQPASPKTAQTTKSTEPTPGDTPAAEGNAVITGQSYGPAILGCSHLSIVANSNVPAGTSIEAVADGEVIVLGEQGTYGNMVAIDQGKGIITVYAHCSELAVENGDYVHRGQVIAYTGHIDDAASESTAETADAGDTAAPAVISILAATDGLVTAVRPKDDRSHVVTIDHGDGLILGYGHCSKVVVKAGDHIRRGQIIAYAGNPAPESSTQPTSAEPSADVWAEGKGGKISLPCEGRVTAIFSYRKHPVTGDMKLHTGIDIAASTGTPIKAVADGEVLISAWQGAYGNAVIIDHGKGTSTLYAHCSRLAVEKGRKVNRGDVIAYVGATGYATGPQCHFEKRVNGVPVDPLKE